MSLDAETSIAAINLATTTTPVLDRNLEGLRHVPCATDHGVDVDAVGDHHVEETVCEHLARQGHRHRSHAGDLAHVLHARCLLAEETLETNDHSRSWRRARGRLRIR